MHPLCIYSLIISPPIYFISYFSFLLKDKQNCTKSTIFVKERVLIILVLSFNNNKNNKDWGNIKFICLCLFSHNSDPPFILPFLFVKKRGGTVKISERFLSKALVLI